MVRLIRFLLIDLVLVPGLVLAFVLHQVPDLLLLLVLYLTPHEVQENSLSRSDL